MKTLPLAAVAAIVMAGLQAGPALAQNAAGANATKYHIAVVDVAYIFKNHERFRASMDGMKGKMQTIEQQLEADRKAIIDAEQQKNSMFKPGTAEFKQADERIAQQKAQFQLKMDRLRKEFLEEEAKHYFSTYQEVSQAIAYYAQQRGIGLVMRFNGETADPAQREQILRDINKEVQFQDSIDITPDVLQMVNRSQVGARPAAPAR